MKKLMILAVMLAMAAAAAIPALAQDREQDASNARGNSGGSVVANTTPSSGGSEDDNLSYNADPAPADGSSETPARPGVSLTGKRTTNVRGASVVLSHVGVHTLSANEVGGSLPPSRGRRPHPAGALSRRRSP